MQQKNKEVLREVLEKIVPKQKEKEEMEKIAASLERKVSLACEEFNVEAIIRLEGSVAKNTWLTGDPDIDIFVRLPTTVPRKDLDEIGLKVARKATEGLKQIERFAEHPYLEAFLDGTRLNIVPCYNAIPGEWLSATDRTPFHTDYINEHMSPSMHDEVRLLKKFMKGINVYGAEIRVGGFSGYLCELLTLHYGSFNAVLQAFAQHIPKRVVDIEGYFNQREREIELLFPEPLVIIDPVDKRRNVAAAVQSEKLYAFVAASRAFLKVPCEKFFFPPKTIALSADALSQKIEKHGASFIFLTFNGVKAVPDVLWGQIYRTKRSLRKLLQLNDFKVLRDTVWNEEEKDTILVFEIEQTTLPIVKKHLGPPLGHEKECESFLSKYKSNKKVIAGPYIEDDRWTVQIPPKYTNAIELLKAKLKTGGRDIGVPELISKALCRELKILEGKQIKPIYLENQDFSEFLTDFLSGHPFWL
jgi:tRNA nucleotidyltransferase (CCA-adding enzyme)